MATYYVNGSTGNNAWTGLSATFTSGTTGPWATIGHAISAATNPGDVVNVEFGTGNYQENPTFNGHGAAGNPITFNGVGNPVITTIAPPSVPGGGQGQVIVSGSWYVIQGFTFHSNLVRGNSLNVDATNLCYSLYTQSTASNIIFQNCLWENMACSTARLSSSPGDSPVIRAEGTNVTIQNSVIRNLNDIDAFGCGFGTNAVNLLIKNVEVYGIDNPNYASALHSDFFQGGSPGSSVLIDSCWIHDCAHCQIGITTGVTGVVYHNCIFHNVTSCANFGDSGSWLNCTWDNCPSGFLNSSAGMVLKNNLLSNGMFISGSAATMANNVTVAGNPGYSNASGTLDQATDFQLATGSSAIGAGATLSPAFPDYGGTTRTVPWDVGAWKYGTATGSGPSYLQGPLGATLASGTSITKAFGAPLTTHSLLIAFVNWGADTGTISSVADGLNGAWTLGKLQQGNTCSSAVYYLLNSAAGAAPTVTVTFGASVPFPELVIYEVSPGASNLWSLDGTPNGATAAGANPTTGNITTTGINDLIFAGYSGNAVESSATAGFSLFQTTNANSVANQFTTTAGTYSCTWTTATTTSANVIIGFRSSISNISPSGIASTNLFGTAVITRGAVNIAPSGIASVTAFGLTSLLSGYLIVPSGIAETNAFGTPGVSTGPVFITPAGIGKTNAFGTALLNAGTGNIYASGIGSTNAFGVPVITAGAINIFAFGIGSTTAFGDTALNIVPIVIAPIGIASTTRFGVPTVSLPDSPVNPYAGQDQESQINVPAWIAYKEAQWEEGCWVMPPYASIFPPDEEAPSLDVVPPPIRATDLWSAMQEWPL